MSETSESETSVRISKPLSVSTFTGAFFFDLAEVALTGLLSLGDFLVGVSEDVLKSDFLCFLDFGGWAPDTIAR